MTVTTQRNSDLIKLIDRRWPYSKDMPQSPSFSAVACLLPRMHSICLASSGFVFYALCFFLFRVLRYLVASVVFRRVLFRFLVLLKRRLCSRALVSCFIFSVTCPAYILLVAFCGRSVITANTRKRFHVLDIIVWTPFRR